MAANNNTRRAMLIRSGIVFAGMLLFGGLIMTYVFRIQFVEGKKWTSLADSLSTKVFDIEAVRGNIFDCNGNLLATSLPIYDVRIDGHCPAFMDEEFFASNIDSLSLQLSNLFRDKTAQGYKNLLLRVKQTGNRYFLLKRKIGYREMSTMRTFPIFRLGKFTGGLQVTERDKREKPFNMLAERTIGFKQEGVVKVGLEGSFDKDLSGKKGKQVMQRIAGGTWVPINDEDALDATQGKDVYSTIDINLQDVAESALKNTLTENDAAYGTAILMEVATGEIKAIANLTRTSPSVYEEQYNYAVGAAVEPGSTMKLISAMALLDDGFVTVDDQVDAEQGEKRFCNATMKDSHLGTGKITFQEAFEHSSNVGIAKEAFLFYQKHPENFYAHLKALGLNQKLGIQITGEGIPFVKSPSDHSWSCTSLPWISIGYEILLTPLQVLTVYNAIPNNGRMVRPLFVKKVTLNGHETRVFPTQVMNEAVCKPRTVEQLRHMMEGVVLRGTASELKSGFYSYAGKTGTAVVAKDRHGYAGGSGKSYRASFCGYFPAENPKYSCFVLVGNPGKANYYAAKVALPVFKEIADKVYANALNMHKEMKFSQFQFSKDLPGVPKASLADLKFILNTVSLSSHLHADSIKEEECFWANAQPQDKSVALQPLVHPIGQVPDVRGMGAKDAMYLLESKGMKVRVSGLGRVSSQSVKPGEALSKYKYIQIQLGRKA